MLIVGCERLYCLQEDMAVYLAQHEMANLHHFTTLREVA